MDEKRISVILCTYNGERFIGRQLESLVRQTHLPHELIVQDDGSTDGTLRIVNACRQQHPELDIRLYRNAERLGFNRNFLSAVRRARGDYIACCDQDDVWAADKLETLAKAIGDSPLIFHNSYVRSRGGQDTLLHARPLPAVFAPLAAALYPRAYGHQLLFRRDVLERLQPFEGCNVSYDYLLFTLAASIGPVRYLHVPLVYWQRHEDAATYRTSAAPANRWKGYVEALRALARKDNRQATRRYFALLGQVPFADAPAMKAVRRMGTGSLSGILATCLLCLRHRRDTAAGTHGPTRWLRAFFLPLFFIRDHGRYIIKTEPV